MAIELKFSDREGHLYEERLYESMPIGYEYVENDFIHWFESDTTNYLSVNNMYIKTIRLVLPHASNYKMRVTSNSDIFTFVRYNGFLEDILLNKDKTYDLTNRLTKTLEDEDMYAIPIGLKLENGIESPHYIMIPLYITVYAEEEGSWTSNLLIEIKQENETVYCPITVGAEIKDEDEPLVINGKNMGVNLPKDIVKAIYSEPIFNDCINETLYNEKIKEYLLNYMSIRGECGNYKSAENSLKWFGWGDKVTLYSLLKTDNEFCNQYLRDRFDVSSDIISEYNKFRKTTYLSLSVNESYEGQYTEQNMLDFFWGEWKPEILSYFDKTIDKKYLTHYNISENVEITESFVTYVRSYYDYCFTELGLKLLLLASYYERYFLPIHIDIFTSSINHLVFTNDIKFFVPQTTQKITEKNIVTNVNDGISVVFPKDKSILLYKQFQVIDELFNSFVSSKIYIYSVIIRIFDIILYYKAMKHESLEYICNEIRKDVFVIINGINGNFQDTEDYKFIYELFTNKEISNVDVLSKFEERYSLETIRQYIDEYYSELNSNYIDDIVAQVPIDIVCGKDSFVSCILLLLRLDNELEYNEVFSSSFCYINSDDCVYNSFIISPRMFRGKYVTQQYDCTYWANREYRLNLQVNGEWFVYDFKLRIPNYNIEIGKLEYDYSRDYSQFSNLRNRVFRSNISEPMLVSVYNSSFYSDLMTVGGDMGLMKKLSDKYDGAIHIPSNFKHYNIVLYCDIYKNGVKLKYEGGTELYDVFNDTISSRISTMDSNLYLMHDKNYWYAVLISKTPLSEYEGIDNPSVSKIIQNKSVTINEYTLKNFKVYKRFLVNRMKYVLPKVNGQFYDNDLICARLVTDSYQNPILPFNLNSSTQWKFENLDFNKSNVSEITSNTAMGIVSVGSGGQLNKKGYYKVSIRFNIDDIVDHQQIKSCKFKVI